MNDNTPAASGAAPADILSLLESAAYMCECYADFIKREVKAADIEQHPYLPELEGVAEDIRETLAALTPREAAVLASPQVAPAPKPTLTETRLRALSDRAWESWNASPDAFPSFAMCLARLILEDLATPVQVAPQPTPYVDSNPQLHVGESSFEDWYQNYLPNSVGHKQIARDAYAAGMGDPLVAPQDDARDAAEVWNEAIEAAAKRIENGSFLHDKSPAKLFANELTPVIRSMKRTPAAKPTEPTLPTQGEQSHD